MSATFVLGRLPGLYVSITNGLSPLLSTLQPRTSASNWRREKGGGVEGEEKEGGGKREGKTARQIG